MKASTKAQTIATTINASNLSDADLVKLFTATMAEPQTPAVQTVLAGVIANLVSRNLVTLPA